MAPAALAFWEASLRKAVATDALKKELDEQHSAIKALLTDRGLVK